MPQPGDASPLSTTPFQHRDERASPPIVSGRPSGRTLSELLTDASHTQLAQFDREMNKCRNGRRILCGDGGRSPPNPKLVPRSPGSIARGWPWHLRENPCLRHRCAIRTLLMLLSGSSDVREHQRFLITQVCAFRRFTCNSLLKL